jgi:hypothetical protein
MSLERFADVAEKTLLIGGTIFCAVGAALALFQPQFFWVWGSNPPIALSRLESIAVGLIFAALAAFAAFTLSDKPSVRAWRTHCLFAVGAGMILLWGMRFFAIGV